MAIHLPAVHRRPEVRPASPRWTLALTAVAFFMVSLDLLVVMTALPAIQHDLGAGLSTLEWTVNAYSLASAAGIITAARWAIALGGDACSLWAWRCSPRRRPPAPWRRRWGCSSLRGRSRVSAPPWSRRSA